ncbi:MAG: hypothetical protein ACRD6N_12785 [Pyrinomonadaceae bacterium]
MKTKVGVMGSAADISTLNDAEALRKQALALGKAIAIRDVILLTGATTGLVYAVGKAAHDAGVLHVGISPAISVAEHVARYALPTDACDLIVYTGFGLKGRNVVLVRSCDVVLFISGGMGSLNEFTIAHDEGKIIGCLTGTGGVADEAGYLVEKFSHKAGPRVFEDSDAERLIDMCIAGTTKEMSK